MSFPFRKSQSRASPRTAAAPPLRFALTRIVGNDLPPRHEPGQALSNLRFILQHEPTLEHCARRWIVNRIADPQAERAVVALLDEFGQAYERIEFRPDEFARLRIETVTPPTGGVAPEAAMRIRLRAEQARINYAIPINQARNAALRGTDADWRLPFDGNCFLPPVAWTAIRDGIARHPGWRYVVVPMARVTRAETILDPAFRPKAVGEPQIIFHRDATLDFHEAYSYGRRDKVELLWRLGVRGPWDKWKDDPWDLPRSQRCAAARGEVGTAGWVVRLSSGRDALERAPKADRARNSAREEALIRFLVSLDQRVQGASLEAT